MCWVTVLKPERQKWKLVQAGSVLGFTVLTFSDTHLDELMSLIEVATSTTLPIHRFQHSPFSAIKLISGLCIKTYTGQPLVDL